MVCPNGRVFDLFARIRIDLSDFDRGLNEASGKFKSFSNNLSKVGSGMKDLLSPAVDGFKAVEGVGKQAGSAIQKGLTGFAAASTAVGGGMMAAANAGMQFDAAMSEVSAISGATGDDFDALRAKALQMAASTKFGASEVAQAYTYMGMAGWKTGDMLSGVPGILNLAAASGEDLATTSDIVTNALSAFGMQASESGHFADILATASSNANTDVHMMGESFKYAAPVMGALGYTAEDTAVALGLMGNYGIQASMAGTSLKTAMLNMASPTKAMAGVMKKYGISLTDANEEMYSLGELMVQLREKMGGLDETTQAAAASTLFGKEAATGMLAIINAAPEDFDKLTAAIDNCNGSAERISKTMMDNLAGDIDYMKSAFESLQIAISDSLTPTLREFAQFGQKAMAGLLEGFQGGGVSGFMSALSGIVTDGVTMLAEKAPEFVDVSLQFVDSLIQGLLNGSDAMFSAGEQIITQLVDFLWYQFENNYPQFIEAGKGIIEMIFNGFTQAGEVISMYIGEFVPLIAEAFLSYHEALFTVGLDILGAIGQGIIENKESLQSMASETIANMVTALRDNAPAIIEGGIALLEALVGAIEENLPLILETGGEIIGKLIEGISTASPGVQAIITTAVLPFIAKIIDVVGGIGGAVKDAWGVIKKVIDLVTGGEGLEKIISIGKKLVSGIQALFTLIMAHPVIAVITAIIAALVLLWTNCEEFRDIVKGVLEAVGGFFKLAYEVITGAFAGAVDFFSGVIEGIKGVFDGIGEFLGGLFTEAFDLVQGAWGSAIEFFSNIGNSILGAFETVTDFLGSAFSEAWGAARDAWGSAIEFFSGVREGIDSAFSTVVDFFGGLFSDAFHAVTNVWEGAIDFFGGIVDGILGAFSNIGEQFLSIGGSIVDGLKNGVAKAWESFMGWLNDKVGGIVNGVKSMLGIHSPSTVFAGIGENMALGLAEGWGDQYSSIKRQIENGMNFGTATVGLNVSGRFGSGAYGSSNGQPANRGGDTFNFYSPKALDPVSAAREMKKAKQQMALGYV